MLAGSSGALVDLGFTRDANGNVTAVSDNLGAARDAAYAYTDAGRLSAATGAWGADAYHWDANSNRTRADRTVGGGTFSDVATIAAASNQLTEVRDGDSVHRDMCRACSKLCQSIRFFVSPSPYLTNFADWNAPVARLR